MVFGWLVMGKVALCEGVGKVVVVVVVDGRSWGWRILMVGEQKEDIGGWLKLLFTIAFVLQFVREMMD